MTPKRLLLTGLAVLGLLGMVVAADLAAVSLRYGLEYGRRLVLWRGPDPRDGERFPARAIAASDAPLRYPAAGNGAAAVRAAFPGPEAPEAFLARTGTTSFLVLRDGRLLYEGYFNEARRETAVGSFSMAKSVTAMLVGAALADGLLPSLATPVTALLPEVAGLRGSDLTLEHLLRMRAGFELAEARPFGILSVPWIDSKVVYFAPDLRRIAAAVRPVHPPGTRFLYDDRNAMLLGMVLERATGRPVADYLGVRLWGPLGAEFPASWSLDSTASGFEKMESGINARPVDLLKLGDLVLRRGVRADGLRVLPAAWVDLMTAVPEAPAAGFPEDAAAGGPGLSYGLLWWGFARAEGPPDAYAAGIFGQVLYVSRARRVVILRTGNGEGGVASWPALVRGIADRLP